MTEQQQYPTREQIAELLRAVYDEAAEVARHATRVPFDIDYTAADAVLALFPQPTPSAEPVAAWRDRHGDEWTEGDDGLLHTRETAPFSREYVEKKWGPLVAVAAPPSIAEQPTPSAEHERRHLVTTTGQEILAELPGIAEYLRSQGYDEKGSWVDRAADHIEFLDPSTIRDVTPPPA